VYELVLPGILVQLLLLLVISPSSSFSIVGVVLTLSFFLRLLIYVFSLYLALLLVALLLSFVLFFILDPFSTSSSPARLSGALLCFFNFYLFLWLFRIRLFALFTEPRLLI